MKKRLFSLLLSLCLVAGLFAGMTTAAYADGDTWQYTVTKDDGGGVASICAREGIDFQANKEWIKNTNKFRDDFFIRPGMTITLPVKGKVLTWTSPASTTGTTTGTIASTTTAATGSFSVPTQTYTLKSGDFVSVICEKLGVDFAANDAWIRQANNITNYNNLKVGRVIVLPAKGTTPPLSTAGTGTTYTSAIGAVSTVATTTTGTAAVGLLAGDTVSYYISTYTVKSGDTLYNICQNFGASMDTVQKMNGIADASKLRVGQQLSIPSGTAGGTAVVAHKVVSGDTVQGICQKYGVDYGKNATTIKGLNNRDNLDAIKVGQTILIPVKNLGSGTASGGTSAGTIVSAGTTGTAYYTLNKNGTVNGTYALTVNGQAVNGAAAGQIVHVVTTPDHGYKLSAVSVVRDYNGVAVQVDQNNNFVMPACDVRITVSYVSDPNAAPHSLNASAVSNVPAANLTFVVAGYTNTKAEPGKSVSIVLGTLPSGQMVDKVFVTTVNPASAAALTNGSIDASKYVTVTNMSFVMPASDVFVTVLLKGA